MTRLLIFSSILFVALAIALPARLTTKSFKRGLDKREDSYTTKVTMDPTRLSYGNVKPADVLQHLSGPCNDQLTGCDYANVAALSVPSQMYVNADTIPISGTLKLDPKGDFLIGEGSEFVGCITKTAPFGTQCETKSWNVINPNPRTPTPPNSRGTASFCTMSNFVECTRVDSVTGDPAGYLQVGVTFTADPGSSFDFCSLLSLASSLAGVLGPFFGVAGWACTTAEGAGGADTVSPPLAVPSAIWNIGGGGG